GTVEGGYSHRCSSSTHVRSHRSGPVDHADDQQCDPAGQRSERVDPLVPGRDISPMANVALPLSLHSRPVPIANLWLALVDLVLGATHADSVGCFDPSGHRRRGESCVTHESLWILYRTQLRRL